MRPTWGYLIGGCVAVLAAALLVRGQPGPAAPADAARPARTMTAIGSATATARPDSARVTFTVMSAADTVAEASRRNATLIRAVRAAVAGLNIRGLQTRTADSFVHPTPAKDDPAKILDYKVGQSFTVRLTDPDPDKLTAAAERVLDAGLQNGVNGQGGVEFFLADDTGLRREAMRKAVEDALMSAKAYAAGAKVEITEVTLIDGVFGEYEMSGGTNVNPFAGMQQPANPGGGTLSAGNWQVSSRVRITCQYRPAQ